MQYDRAKIVDTIDEFFSKIDSPEKMDVEELIVVIEAIIPVHTRLLITDYDQVDILLSVYPYLFQKLMKVYAHFVHGVRMGMQNKDKKYTDMMRSYRDPIEQILKAVRMQYDALSRRITNNVERRG